MAVEAQYLSKPSLRLSAANHEAWDWMFIQKDELQCPHSKATFVASAITGTILSYMNAHISITEVDYWLH